MNNTLGILGTRCAHVSRFENSRKSRESKENFQCKEKSMYVASPKNISVLEKRGVCGHGPKKHGDFNAEISRRPFTVCSFSYMR